MCTKGIWQLQTLVVRYCPIGGSSAGTREFLRKGFLDFATQNPQIQCKAILGKSKHPVVEGRYVWGVNKVCDLRNKNPKQILDLIQLLRNTSGHKVAQFKVPIVTQKPSIQGQWQPGITNKIKFQIKSA
jgi:large subunit ribosomal protein L43